ncbi:MAG TPA: PAS domain S-box protein [Nitrospira sp.]|nr:PAS domain S-box protein [Nitrospira sp.]
MKKPTSAKFTKLRQRVESSLGDLVKKSLPTLKSRDVKALVHELRLHELELEVQYQDLQAAQAELEASRNRYRELYESIPLGYVTIDLQGRILELNPAGVELFGESRGGRSLKNFNFYVDKEDLDRFTLFCRQVLATQKPGTGEFKMKRLDDRPFFAWLQAIPVTTDHVEDQQLRIAFKDITERKQGEQLLRHRQAELAVERDLAETSLTGALRRESQTARELLESSLRLESIVQSAMDAIITVDNTQRILLFNQAAEAMFRCPAAEAIGQPIDRFIPARFQHAHRHHIERFGRSGETSRKMGKLGTVAGLRSDGTEFPLEASISHVTVEGNKFFTVILRDVSERTRLEQQLRRTERIAELGTMAGGMAHEIGTPMNVILGRAEYLMDRVHDEPAKKGLKTIITQVERITRVMNQLLSFARRKPTQLGPVDLGQIIENCLEMFQERLSNQRVHVETHIAHECPPAQADSDQMNQVLINLIMNAIHAMSTGGTLRIDLHQDGSMVKCTVADTGHGISKEVQTKIFEPFFTTKEFGKGTGLGLTVVKGIIEEHHGSITVESEEGKGTSFTILLPKSVAATSA